MELLEHKNNENVSGIFLLADIFFATLNALMLILLHFSTSPVKLHNTSY